VSAFDLNVVAVRTHGIFEPHSHRPNSGERQTRELRSFQQAVSGSDVVFIVGSGLSATTTGGAPTATWGGLIRSGADRAERLDNSFGMQWRGLVDGLLAYPETDTVIQAAGMVAGALRRIGDSAFNQWLSEDIGDLEVRDDSAARALLSYPFPILTTNYDTLLETVGGRQSTDWTDVRGFHEVVTRSSDAIGHLHGLWNNPVSVVLSETDYAQFRAHKSIEALERAVSALKSIVYVGFGAGLSDPNFAALLRWHRAAFPESGVTHFRLCRTSDEAELQKIHADENVIPVVYGDAYEDLASFLQRHTPSRAELVLNDAGLARDVIQETRDLLRDSMTSESVLFEAGGAEFIQADLVMAPVLLPVQHASFVRDRMRNGAKSDIAPLDGHAEVQSHDFFVVVGDEGSGLSTAVKWLATQSSDILGSAAPLFVRFADCRTRRDPLNNAVTNAAMSVGFIHDRGDTLPAHVLALDDFDPGKRRAADAVLAQLVQSPAIVKVVGCRQGGEDDLVGMLRNHGVEPRLLFLGRMRRADIVELAERLAPGQGEQIAEEALRVLDSEGLKRTPLTVSLLLFQLVRGGPREATNQTSLMDAHLSLLLGVGDPHEDGTGLTDTDVQAILSNLAEAMIWDETPSLAEHEAVRKISEIISKYGWSASAFEVLAFLVRRRVLRRHGDQVEFGRYSYFTLFAAKRATVDADFRELIANDIFYYKPVATRLAALMRTDEDLLARLQSLLKQELSDSSVAGSPYELMPRVTVDAAPIQAASADARAIAPVSDDEDDDDQDVEFPESNSPGSFGLVTEDMPAIARIHRTLDLASSVLRDLDQVEALELKRKSLVMTLELWGRFITTLSGDSALTDVKEAISRTLTESPDGPVSGDMDRWVEFIARSIPAGTVLAGMESTLTSPKLVATLNEALRLGELDVTHERTTATLFFLFLMRPSGWASKAISLAEGADPTWVLAHFFRALCEDAYARGGTPENELLDLCKTLFALDQAYTTPDIRSAHLNLYAKRLRNLRARTLVSTPN